jgi:PhnB protein
MTQINAYLNFNGQCREAMTFYQECLGGELTLQRVAESPMAAQLPAVEAANIMHSILIRGGLVLLASDMIGNKLEKGNTITLCLKCSSNEEINTCFDKLAVGGKIKMPLHQSFWGSTYGELTDKYGMNWMFHYARN